MVLFFSSFTFQMRNRKIANSIVTRKEFARMENVSVFTGILVLIVKKVSLYLSHCSHFTLYCFSFLAVCPVLCSGNGIFTSGKCHCHQGWKGVDCNVPSNICEVPNCNRNGQCNTNGECVCDKGFRGKFCNERMYFL